MTQFDNLRPGDFTQVNSLSEAFMQKPPLGLIPRNMHNYHRAIEIVNAMDRYVHSEKMIPREWIDELRDIYQAE